MRTARSEFVDYLVGEVAALKRTIHERDELIWKLIARPAQVVEKPFVVSQPQSPQPDLAAIARAMGEAFATTINGPAQLQIDGEKIAADALAQTMEDLTSGRTEYPDVEFDEYMNPDPPEMAVPVGPDQMPVHAFVNGRMRRMDGTPMFFAGDGSGDLPTGGVE